MKYKLLSFTLTSVLLLLTMTASAEAASPHAPNVQYRSASVDGLKIFYREAGPENAPTIVLLHGFPSSSHMFRELIPLLADRYHVIAPDYPGFGYSDAPSADRFAYTFDHLSDVVEHFLEQIKVRRYAIYIQDYGAPVGFRLATRHPEQIRAIVVQNGNAYEEGLSPFWSEYLYPYWKERTSETENKVRQLLTLASTRFQYQQGDRAPDHVNPDSWTLDQIGLDRSGNDAIQLSLFYDYRVNPGLYPGWHQYLRQYQPPVLVVWGKNDPVFTIAGAEAYRKDVPKAELHLLDTGHFALEEDAPVIAGFMRSFFRKNLR